MMPPGQKQEQGRGENSHIVILCSEQLDFKYTLSHLLTMNITPICHVPSPEYFFLV